LLGFLLEAVIEDPAQNERGRLLELARNFYAQRLRRPERDGAAGAGAPSSG
jgi:hypothetical protein